MAETGKNVSIVNKMFCATCAGATATLLCYPLDLLRFNMQVTIREGAKRVTTYGFVKEIVNRDGISGMYTGLTAGVLMQALFVGTRLGLYQVLFDMVADSKGRTTFLQKILIGSVSGVAGALLSLPPDVVMVRMAVDKRVPPEQRRNYKHVFDGLHQVYTKEGPRMLYTGMTPTIARAVAVNLSQVVSYFQFKQFALKHGICAGDTPGCHFVSSLFASLTATICVLPVDITKTRIQNQKRNQGIPEYKNMLDVWVKVVRNEGVFALWKGFTPLFLRMTPHSIVTFLTMTAAVVVYPLDILRLNMQVSGQMGEQVKKGKTTLAFAKEIVVRDGFLGLYNGISASVARQCLYTGPRLGLFQILSDYVSRGGKATNVLEKFLIGTVSGAVGAVIGLPADVVLSRMAVDYRLPIEKRRNYHHVFDGFVRIYKEEGFLTLYRGGTPAIIRAIVANISQVGSYFQTKEFIVSTGYLSAESMACQFICSVVASFCSSVCVLPIDITKTRIQNMRVTNGVPEYTSMLDVWVKLMKHESVFALWKGFTPFFLRNAPLTIVTFITYENLLRVLTPK